MQSIFFLRELSLVMNNRSSTTSLIEKLHGPSMMNRHNRKLNCNKKNITLLIWWDYKVVYFEMLQSNQMINFTTTRCLLPTTYEIVKAIKKPLLARLALPRQSLNYWSLVGKCVASSIKPRP